MTPIQVSICAVIISSMSFGVSLAVYLRQLWLDKPQLLLLSGYGELRRIDYKLILEDEVPSAEPYAYSQQRGRGEPVLCVRVTNLKPIVANMASCSLLLKNGHSLKTEGSQIVSKDDRAETVISRGQTFDYLAHPIAVRNALHLLGLKGKVVLKFRIRDTYSKIYTSKTITFDMDKWV